MMSHHQQCCAIATLCHTSESGGCAYVSGAKDTFVTSHHQQCCNSHSCFVIHQRVVVAFVIVVPRTSVCDIPAPTSNATILLHMQGPVFVAYQPQPAMLQYPLFCHSSGSGSCAWGYLSGTNCQQFCNSHSFGCCHHCACD